MFHRLPAALLLVPTLLAAQEHDHGDAPKVENGGVFPAGFGVFIGGKDLAGAGQRITYFLIRGDGKYKIKRRSAASATDVTRDWTAAPAIAQEKPDGPVVNLVSVVVGKDGVSFRVNGQQVYLAPAKEVDTGGIVGLRVNHNLSLHIETLQIKPAS